MHAVLAVRHKRCCARCSPRAARKCRAAPLEMETARGLPAGGPLASLDSVCAAVNPVPAGGLPAQRRLLPRLPAGGRAPQVRLSLARQPGSRGWPGLASQGMPAAHRARQAWLAAVHVLSVPPCGPSARRYAVDQFCGGRTDPHAVAAARLWWSANVAAAGLPMMFMGTGGQDLFYSYALLWC